MDKDYSVSVEVEAPFAMFADRTSGSESVSYPAPPFSAAKGILESILFLKNAVVIPTKVHICRPTRFVNVGYNSTSTHARKDNLIKGGFALQMRELALFRPVFQIFARVESATTPINHAHSYQEQFDRRLERGQSWRRPCLGRSDFPCTYVGPLRTEMVPCPEVNHFLPTFLHHPFDKNQNGQLSERSVQNVVIQDGVLIYA